MRERLYRSRTDRVIGGLAAGLGRNLGIDVTWVRLGWVVLAFLTQGIAILVYIVLLFVIPEEPEGYVPPPRVDPLTGQAPGVPGATPGDETTTTAWASAADPPVGTTPRASTPPPPSALEQWIGGARGSDGSRTAAMVVGIVLVGAGAWLLIRRYIDFDLGWPVVAIVLGVLLVAASLRLGGRQS